jgi:hypothetical protein
MWLQYDFGDGPVIDGSKTTLFCAWLAWCRFAGGARDLGQDRAERVRRAGCHAAPPGWGTDLCALDNEKTVTIEHVAGMAVRNPATVGLPGTTR